MAHLDVFDPPMCCSSGVCGPGVDPLLAAFAADVDWLTSQGVTVTRHNLAQDPQAFVAHPLVKDLLHREGDSCLPLVFVNGEIAGHGSYPRRDELARLAGLTASASRAKPRIRLTTTGGCKPGSGCC
ncbi:MAG: arsenite efflux transporter metallochaperone ArsD [Betaproteobacteria bacterium]